MGKRLLCRVVSKRSKAVIRPRLQQHYKEHTKTMKAGGGRSVCFAGIPAARFFSQKGRKGGAGVGGFPHDANPRLK